MAVPSTSTARPSADQRDRWLEVGHSARSGGEPRLLIVFCSGAYDLDELLAGIGGSAPGVPLIGRSTAGEIATGGSEDRVGVEALVRWRLPQRGLVAADAFIPLAEEMQLMPELGRWILLAACRQTALAGSGLAPSSLVPEITETALMRDVEDTITCLSDLKRLGVLLAVDDFGTGYSSLDYLRRFPIHMLKIDKALVDDLVAGDSKLARAIIDLGDSFGLQVVAEGVEHEARRRRLLELGCGFGQGYRFARPMPCGRAVVAPGDPDHGCALLSARRPMGVQRGARLDRMAVHPAGEGR